MLCRFKGCPEDAFSNGPYFGYCLQHGRLKNRTTNEVLLERLYHLADLLDKFREFEDQKARHKENIKDWNETLRQMRLLI